MVFTASQWSCHVINVLIVDDERLARVELVRLLSKFEQINIVAQASSGEEAIDLLAKHQIDVVFLDIQMPEMTGLQLAQHIDASIQCVFCTAYNEHAVDAFSLNAADYIVKPINMLRLEQTIARLQSGTELIEGSYLPDSHGLMLKIGQASHIVKLSEIERFESIGNHVAVYCSQGKSFIHSSLSKVEKRLDPQIYFKASRSDIIRIDHINKIEEGMASGSLVAILNSGQQIEVSRRQAKNLKDLYNVW